MDGDNYSIEIILVSLEEHIGETSFYWKYALHKKWGFPLRISSVNVTKFAVCGGFSHIY